LFVNKINLQSLAWLEIFVFLRNVLDTGTGLGGAWEFAVAYDAGLGVVLSQLLQQFVESVALQFGAGVVCDAVLIESALVAHGYRTAVETAGVHTPHALWQYRHHRAVAPYIVVI
jgi:hypothetical protein